MSQIKSRYLRARRPNYICVYTHNLYTHSTWIWITLNSFSFCYFAKCFFILFYCIVYHVLSVFLYWICGMFNASHSFNDYSDKYKFRYDYKKLFYLKKIYLRLYFIICIYLCILCICIERNNIFSWIQNISFLCYITSANYLFIKFVKYHFHGKKVAWKGKRKRREKRRKRANTK